MDVSCQLGLTKVPVAGDPLVRSSADAPVTVILCDDHPVTRAGLAATLSAPPDIEVVGQAEDGEKAVALASRLRPRVVVMDLMMPRMDGFEATRRVKAAIPDTGVLVLTSYDNEAQVVGAMSAGADGYVLKDATFEQLIDAVRAVAAGRFHLSPGVAPSILSSTVSSLTSDEVATLRLVADGLTNREIADELFIAEPTVKYRLRRVYEKLDANNRAAAVKAAKQLGLLENLP